MPHFELKDDQDIKSGRMLFDRENPQVATFYLHDEEERGFYLNLDTIGKRLPREKFTLEMWEK